MVDSPQNLYAKNLQQSFGYPLRRPEPKPGLPSSYLENGLHIGDIGHVDGDGMFNVLFNICFPPDHDLHWAKRNSLDGLVGLTKFDPNEVPLIPDGISAGCAICHGIEGSQGDNLKHTQGIPCKFKACSSSGAILILPSGAIRQNLDKHLEEEFRKLAEERALDWCQFAKCNSLYLITGFYKARSWHLASFRDVEPSSECVLLECDDAGRFIWSTHCDCRRSAEENIGDNQTMFISGFKIEVRRWDNHTQALIHKLPPNSRSTWSSLTWWASFLLGILLSYWQQTASRFKSCVHGKCEDTNAGVHIGRVPAFSQPFHPSDIINRYLLDKNPHAQVAITHDDQWLSMIEEERLSLDHMTEAGVFLAFLEENYVEDSSSNGVVYLQKKINLHKSALSSKTFFIPTAPYNARQLIITGMRIENIITCPEHIPAGFYVSVDFDSSGTRSKCKPASLLASVIEWEDEITLHMDPTTNVRFSTIASFEFEPMVGTGNLLCMIETTVSKLIEGGSICLLFSSKGSESAFPCPSLLVTLEERQSNSFSDLGPGNINLGGKAPLPWKVAEETDKGHNALLQYHNGAGMEMLLKSVECFGRALEHCTPCHESYAAVLCNHTMAAFVNYQAHGIIPEPDVMIGCYRRVLALRPGGHPDRPRTLLHLAQALLYCQGRRQCEESTAGEIQGLVTEMKRTCAESSYEYRAATLVAQTLKRYRVLTFGELAELDSLILELWLSSRMPPYWHFDRPYRLTNLSLALRKRFEITGNLSSLTMSITLMEEVLQLLWDGHADKPWVLASLGDALRVRFAQCGNPTDLDISISTIKRALEIMPDNHSDKPLALAFLGNALYVRFVQRNNVGDLAESISTIEYVVRLVPDNHCDKPWMLALLIDELRLCCCEKLESVGDLTMSREEYDRAIANYSTALSLNPVHQGLLIKRSKAWMAKKSWDSALNDVNKVITHDTSSPWGYEARHAVLHEMKQYAAAVVDFETMFSKIEHSPDSKIHECRNRYNSPSIVRTIVQRIVKRVTDHLPRVLIHTSTGRLLDRTEQVSTFKSSPAFHELLSSILSSSPVFHEPLSSMTCINSRPIEYKVKRYFRYVMLSHRWQEIEPQFQDVMHTAVHDLDEYPAYDKLKKFCKTVRDSGFNWAWSDTCCIDKRNQVVRQEALVAMFKWYRRAAMVVVYLHDVRPESGDLAGSTWNTRAWTFQEYIAAQVVRFYMEDWTLYRQLEAANHKESPEIITEMEKATGVSAQRLRALCPGLGNIREKLYLASERETTEIEDSAYSLLGIFSVTGITPNYGEREKALGRLLQYLLFNSGDVSILAWTGNPGDVNSCLPASITVYSQPEASYLPLPIRDTEMGETLARTNRTTPDLKLARRFYACLNKLDMASFEANRLQLPCIAFKLPSLSVSPDDKRSNHAYCSETPTFGTVKIKTKQSLSQHLNSLYLLHPWLDALLDREYAHVGALAGDDAVELSSPVGIDDEDRDGSDSSSIPEIKQPLQSGEDTRVLQLIARLRQPFGALLFAHLMTRGEKKFGRRVAADSLITVQISEDVPWEELLDSVDTLNIL